MFLRSKCLLFDTGYSPGPGERTFVGWQSEVCKERETSCCSRRLSKQAYSFREQGKANCGGLVYKFVWKCPSSLRLYFEFNVRLKNAMILPVFVTKISLLLGRCHQTQKTFTQIRCEHCLGFEASEGK